MPERDYYCTTKENPLTEQIINLETVNPIEFFGVNNNKFDILKKKFPLLKILSRGSLIKISGKPEDVETAKEKINLILQYLKKMATSPKIIFHKFLVTMMVSLTKRLSKMPIAIF